MVIYQHGEPWWNIDRGKFLIRPALWQSYQQSYSSYAGETGEGKYEFGLTEYLVHAPKGSFIMSLNLTTWCRRLYISSDGRRVGMFR
jgi:hypothetical protein